jgi:predicted metal-binding protein
MSGSEFVRNPEKLKTRKITLRTSAKQLRMDSEKYRLKALELGASDAKIIQTSKVIIDERVRLKCAVPRCHLYGESANCPPYTLTPDEMRKILRKFKCAILFKINVSPIADFVDDEQWHMAHITHQRKSHEIASVIEALAFNDGYYFATGLAAGGCKTALCAGQICQFLDSGRCRFPLKSRPSMEGVGIDVYNLATKVGWEIYPIAIRDVDPDSVGCAISVGMVLVC